MWERPPVSKQTRAQEKKNKSILELEQYWKKAKEEIRQEENANYLK